MSESMVPPKPTTFCQCLGNAVCCTCGKLALITTKGHNFCWDHFKSQLPAADESPFPYFFGL